tara:strand:- start:656 stop:910 length:255 start_codon:yes stop_codon:yes gene_type:complete
MGRQVRDIEEVGYINNKACSYRCGSRWMLWFTCKRRVEYDWLSAGFGVATIAGKAESARQTSLVLKSHVDLKMLNHQLYIDTAK